MDALILHTILLLFGAFLVGCVLGCWLKGLFSADESVPVRGASSSTTVAAAPAAPSGSFDWMAERTGDSIILDGMVPTIGDRDAIVADAKARFSRLSVDDRMTIGGKVPAGSDWLASATFALTQLDKLSNGDVTLKGSSYALRGVASSKKSYDGIRKALPDDLPTGLRLGSIALDTPAAREPAEPKPEQAAKPEPTAESKPAPAAVASTEGDVIPVELDRDMTGRQPRGLQSARSGKADDLKRIKGIGKVNEGKLNAFGIWHFDQIASWTEDEIDWVNDYIAFPGRIQREDWVGQAKALDEGGDK
ncbi:MAG: hypothetical protein AAGD23_08800 [Pseudomonadota bacterium]